MPETRCLRRLTAPLTWLAVATFAGMVPFPALGASPGLQQEKEQPSRPLSQPEDREIFHFLLAQGSRIQRTVKNLENGVETLTESDDPAVAAKIKEHVKSMYGRLEEGRPIRMRDPLFREVFRHADQIRMKLEETEKGVRVTETSENEWAVRLVQAHAQVVSAFVKNGFAEARRNHSLPERKK